MGMFKKKGSFSSAINKAVGAFKEKGQGGMVQHTGTPPSAPIPLSQEQRIADRKAQLQADGTLLGDTSGMKADDLNALIKRKDWEQFEKQDIPYILNYADSVTSGVHTDRAINQARSTVDKGYAIAQQTQQMQDRGTGVALSDAVKADRVSDMQRNKTASLIDAENNARLAGKDRENALIAGSHMPG